MFRLITAMAYFFYFPVSFLKELREKLGWLYLVLMIGPAFELMYWFWQRACNAGGMPFVRSRDAFLQGSMMSIFTALWLTVFEYATRVTGVTHWLLLTPMMGVFFVANSYVQGELFEKGEAEVLDPRPGRIMQAFAWAAITLPFWCEPFSWFMRTPGLAGLITTYAPDTWVGRLYLWIWSTDDIPWDRINEVKKQIFSS